MRRPAPDSAVIALDRPLASGRRIGVRFSDRHDGDFAIRAAGVAQRRQAVCRHPWTVLEQVHGSEVVAVDRPGQHDGARADGMVTTRAGSALAVQTADCAPVVLIGHDAVGVVHAGWRGVLDGVLQEGLRRLLSLDDGPVVAVIGPCIRPGHYEFGREDLQQLTARLGNAVRAETVDGQPALDLAAAVRAALGADVASVSDLGHDTSDEKYFSNRVRGDLGRQATMVWIEP